ncbi:hypothetical protein [Salinimicrobium sp. GXAS 041]|uniref:hypothetical protein n=1 Tax=Salinimicrobium sp. GXAS 041 TaxID=3400806 RepID=UPI003C72917F
MKIDLIQYLASLCFIYTYGRLAIHIVPEILHHFLNEPIQWNKNLEKPRLLFHLVGLGVMHLVFYSYNSIEHSNLFFQILIPAVFIPGFLFCHFSWTEKFKVSFTGTPKKIIKRSPENFNISISERQATELYNELVRYDLIDQDKTSLEDFKNVLLKDWKSHQSKLHLKMDGPSCREFYDYLTKTYPNNNMTLKNLFITSGLVLRPDGKPYNYNTIKNAPTRTPVSKENKSLKKIFKKLG